MKRLSIVLISVLLLAACGEGKKSNKVQSSEPKEKKEFVLTDGIYAKFSTTRGEFTVRLEMEKAPLTVANFVGLAEGTMSNQVRPLNVPYYDGLTFHRVITIHNGDDQDFMIQGGCPLGNGMGNPGYKFRDEFHPELKHLPGTMSMANSGQNTNGSQFFICVATRPELDGKYSVFGNLVENYDVMASIKKDDMIKHVEIIRIGEAAKAFNAVETFNALK